jgi:hypothetical protein
MFAYLPNIDTDIIRGFWKTGMEVLFLKLSKYEMAHAI